MVIATTPGMTESPQKYASALSTTDTALIAGLGGAIDMTDIDFLSVAGVFADPAQAL